MAAPADSPLFLAAVFLGAAVVLVPLARRLGLGSVVGYLIAGAAIGPFGLRLLGLPPEQIMHFAEFGVVIMLFIIGLELSPQKLWRLRNLVFGLGAAQIVLTAGALTGLLMLAGIDWRVALILGLALAESSTAVAMQTLTERGELKSQHGRSGFAILLMQDIAVIPMLAAIPFIAGVGSGGSGVGTDGATLVKLALAVVAIIVGGRHVTRPLFRFVARTEQRELFTGLCLLLVIGAALTMQWVGVSPALGAFLAGVVLADSEYRHEIESDLEPFKGLLLGIFFISVGASIDVDLVAASPALVALGVAGLMMVKFTLLVALGRLTRLTGRQSVQLGLTLSQGSEFAFVLIAFATQQGAVDGRTQSLVTIVVGLSMFLTPLLLAAFDRLMRGRGAQGEPASSTMADEDRPVIICGFGRFGQIVGRLLIANGFRVTLLDQDPGRIEMLRDFGFEVHYGDAARLDLLRAAGADKARLIVLALNDRERINRMVPLLRRHFPQLRIAARAIDRSHVYELEELDVALYERETFESGLRLGRGVLGALGWRAYAARRAADRFRRRDEKEIEELRHLWKNPEAYRSRARAMVLDLHLLLDEDRIAGAAPDRGWATGGVQDPESAPSDPSRPSDRRPVQDGEG